jgi:hypothetical protein
MPIYTLTITGQEIAKKRMKKTYLLLSILCLPAVIAIAFSSTEVVLFLLLLGLVTGIVVFIALRMVLKIQLSTQLVFDNNNITMQINGRDDVSIRRDEVDRIVFVEGEGYQIFAIGPPRMIRIPIGLQNYEQLSNTIRTWSTIDIHGKLNTLVIILIVSIVIACSIFYRILIHK